MQKRPEDRHQRAEEVVHDFESWLIEHGYAEPTDLVTASIRPVSTQRQSVSQSSAVRALKQGKLIQILHQMDVQDAPRSDDGAMASESDFSLLGEEVKIDLLDSTAGSGITVKPETLRTVRPLIPGEYDDPMLHALNEIEFVRSQSRRSTAKKPTARQAAAKGSKPGHTSANPPLAWYRQVPVWFWTLFLSGYAAAIFLAGILAAMMVVMFGAKG